MISPELVSRIESLSGIRLLPETSRSVTGGCIHQSCLVNSEDGPPFFLKQNEKAGIELFEAESSGLRLLHETEAIRVPTPITHGICGNLSFLLLDGLHLVSDPSDQAAENLALALSRLHNSTVPDECFGLKSDNFIGATPQPNSPNFSWADFFIEYRLEHQFRLAAGLGKTFVDTQTLLSMAHDHLSSLEVSPSLVHGDLWGGNAGFLNGAIPVVFDPASYYADPETDLAFTHLFGGFTPRFYEVYRGLHPSPEPEREILYNLYHILNHFVLFGGGYEAQAEGMISNLLRRL